MGGSCCPTKQGDPGPQTQSFDFPVYTVNIHLYIYVGNQEAHWSAGQALVAVAPTANSSIGLGLRRIRKTGSWQAVPVDLPLGHQ